MPTLKNIFFRGVMDKDTNRAFVKQGVFRHSENLRFFTNDGDDGIANNIKGSIEVGDITDGNNDLKCIGAFFNGDKDVIYYKLASTNGQISIDAEYNIDNGITTVVLKDTNGVLKYNKKGFITGWNEIDGLQFWSEWGNNPRRINTERAKNYGINGFTEDDITVIVKPPLQKLRISLEDTTTSEETENNIQEKFLFFSYQYRYLDGEYSVIAPFTLCAFEPEKFKYDYSEQTNKSMVNKFNQVNIEFNTGSERVTEIRLIFKESNSNKEWIIEDFDKELLGYGHNEIKSFKFNNLKSKRALSEKVIDSFFDNVPKTTKSQSMIDGRLMYAYYKENYNIENPIGQKIELDYKINLLSQDNTVDVTEDDGEGNSIVVQYPSLNPLSTVKSNRDYEVKLSYIFDYGRITTLLSSKTNTIFIPSILCVKKNTLQLELKNKVPLGATGFKIFIRQNKKHYEQILPTLFYKDGIYSWIKLEGADKDKVKKGEYLVVKGDSSGVLNTLVKVKVLEVKEQPNNFLQPADETSSIKERGGFYFKIKPDGFRLDLDDFEQYNVDTYHNSRRRYHDPLTNRTTMVGDAHFYGDTLDDMTTSGTCTLSSDDKKRYLIQIRQLDNGTDPDMFRWSDNNGADWFGGGLGTLVPIIPNTPITLNNGVEVNFINSIGHSLLDTWNVNARGIVENWDSRAYGFFRTWGNKYETMTDVNETKTDEVIENGARIKLVYDEYGRGDTKFTIDTISSGKYDNIEEWFYKEGIQSQMIAQGYTDNTFWFVRGVLKKDNDGNANYLSQNSDGYMTMVLRSKEHETGVKRVKVRTSSELIQTDGNTLLLFETEPKDQPKEVFHEIGKTYRIINGFHSKITDDWETELPNENTDVSQTSSLPLKLTLDWFNAWSYGNAVESYKIKDDYNAHSLDNGVRILSSQKEEYKEVTRVADITWSDVYNDESNFNGLNTFNLAFINFTKLDKENGSIQKLYNDNGNLLVLQEDAVGIMPYNKTIIYDTDGGKRMGINTNILDKNSYRPYSSNLHGISKNPESFVAIGNRKYFTDKVRGDFVRLSNNGVTEINQYLLEHHFSNEMITNKDQFLISGYDPKHKEVLLYMPSSENGTLAYKDTSKGFPTFFTFEPDFMLGANNELYAWKNGVMYRMNANETRNNFFGVQYQSKIKFFVNLEYSVEKVFRTLGLESTHAWFCKLKTKLTSREIPKECFTKKEDYWYSEIMGNTNNNRKANSEFGLGKYAIENGIIYTTKKHNTLSVGDFIFSANLTFAKIEVIKIEDDKITLDSNITTIKTFLIYAKNQNIDGSSIRGDILEVEMISDETEKVGLRAVRTEVTKSNIS